MLYSKLSYTDLRVGGGAKFWYNRRTMFGRTKKNKSKAWVVAVDMGYGHQRAALPFRDITGRIVGLNTVDKEGKVTAIPSAALLLFAGF